MAARREIVTAEAGETVDALVWRAIGRGSGAVEQVLDVNPGLAAGEVLAAGREVIIPGAAVAKGLSNSVSFG